MVVENVIIVVSFKSIGCLALKIRRDISLIYFKITDFRLYYNFFMYELVF